MKKSFILSIKNFVKIDSYFFRGSQPCSEDFKYLAKLGIKSVVNLRRPYSFNINGQISQKSIAKEFGMNYFNIPMIQTRPPTSEQIECFFDIIENPDQLPVFVHCDQGKDRTGIMTALYRVKKHNWSFDQAYSEMLFYGHHNILFPVQKYFLADFACNLDLE